MGVGVAARNLAMKLSMAPYAVALLSLCEHFGHVQTQSFEVYQSIPTSGATDWEHFEIAGNHFLAVANMHNGASYSIDSKIYQWSGAAFIELQSISTTGAEDWE